MRLESALTGGVNSCEVEADLIRGGEQRETEVSLTVVV